jgi:hypothetical protein
MRLFAVTLILGIGLGVEIGMSWEMGVTRAMCK